MHPLFFGPTLDLITPYGCGLVSIDARVGGLRVGYPLMLFSLDVSVCFSVGIFSVVAVEEDTLSCMA
jgi:hypothetical protein